VISAIASVTVSRRLGRRDLGPVEVDGVRMLVRITCQMSHQIGRKDQQKIWHRMSDGLGLVGGMAWASVWIDPDLMPIKGRANALTPPATG